MDILFFILSILFGVTFLLNASIGFYIGVKYKVAPVIFVSALLFCGGLIMAVLSMDLWGKL